MRLPELGLRGIAIVAALYIGYYMYPVLEVIRKECSSGVRGTYALAECYGPWLGTLYLIGGVDSENVYLGAHFGNKWGIFNALAQGPSSPAVEVTVSRPVIRKSPPKLDPIIPIYRNRRA